MAFHDAPEQGRRGARDGRLGFLDKAGTRRLNAPPMRRGRSSDGRALQSHCRGQGFDSPRLHQPKSLFLHYFLILRNLWEFPEVSGDLSIACAVSGPLLTS
jgi:hypothetical protein